MDDFIQSLQLTAIQKGCDSSTGRSRLSTAVQKGTRPDASNSLAQVSRIATARATAIAGDGARITRARTIARSQFR